MKVLVLGGTGAMGVHAIQFLAEAGHEVIVTSRRDHTSHDSRLTYVKGDAKQPEFLDGLLNQHWDAIIDFMIWSTDQFHERVDGFLKSTDQYVFLSSYRVYADSPVITEDSPRLLDVSDNPEYLATDEYALAKARCENMLFDSGRTNWTIVRPAITYDGSGRFQLTVLESNEWLWRALHGIPVPIPQVMLDKQATMTWGRDVARMISLLIGNLHAMGEAFTVSTAEHMTWRQIADVYREIIPSLDIRDCGMAGFEDAHGAIWQIRYDRMYNRVIDNAKILKATGLQQNQLTTIYNGLTQELDTYLKTREEFSASSISQQARYDRLIGDTSSLLYLSKKSFISTVKYLIRRFV